MTVLVSTAPDENSLGYPGPPQASPSSYTHRLPSTYQQIYNRPTLQQPTKIIIIFKTITNSLLSPLTIQTSSCQHLSHPYILYITFIYINISHRIIIISAHILKCDLFSVPFFRMQYDYVSLGKINMINSIQFYLVLENIVPVA